MPSCRKALLHAAAALILLSPGMHACWAVDHPSASAVTQGGVEGVWQGSLSIKGGTTLRVVLDVSRAANGSLSAILTSIDQGGAKIPFETVLFKDRELHLRSSAAASEYDGTLNVAGTEISGAWKQDGAVLPLNLHRDANIPSAQRPQELKGPYPYRQEEVSYLNPVVGIRLGGTLTLPRSTGPFPAVLLITGSGQQDRDETILGHKPFLIIADYLTRRGIAVLRVDDRGIGASTGDFDKSTTADFATDVRAGINFLETRSDIDHKRIGLIGHSEGGMIAPMVAARSSDVAFIVMMAGPGVPGEQLLLDQNALIERAMGTPEKEIAVFLQMEKKSFAEILRDRDEARAKVRLTEIAQQAIAELPQKDRAQAKQTLMAQIKKLNSPWMRYFLGIDPAVALRRVHCPVLAINGSLDLQVPPKENLPAIAAALAAGGNQDYTLSEIPRLNHLFQTAGTGAPSEYASIEETISPVALEIIGNWIAAHVKPVAASGGIRK